MATVPSVPAAKDAILERAATALTQSKAPGLMPAERNAAEELAAACITAANKTPRKDPGR